jgi:AraC-like DNA-binding protein
MRKYIWRKLQNSCTFRQIMLYLYIMQKYREYNCQIIFSQYLQEVLDHFAACFGIRIAFFNIHGEELRVGMRQGTCGFCKLVRGQLGLLEKCLAGDRDQMKQAVKTGKSVSYHCHAGLREIIKPVYLDKLLIGYVMMGQFRDREMPSAEIAEQWLRQHHQASALRDAFQKTPYYDTQKLEHIIGIFEALVDSTVDKQSYKLEDEEPMFKLKNYLFRHIDRNVPLEEAATYLNWSKSKLTHTIKNKTGHAFKQMQIQMKLSYAEELIFSRGMTIAEAAHATGFSDPCYFSRIYKKYRGVSPAEFKKK